MFRPLLVAAAIAAAITISSPAMAFSCPKNVKAIDASLSKAQLGADQKAKVKQLRDQGAAQHKAGKHPAAMKSLSAAMRIILGSM